VAINCAALPDTLLESELFGYAEGAFTGSRKGGKPGLFEIAHNGTVFLDEIGDAPLSVQSRLLRVIQERTISRLGDDHVIPVDIRLFAATNQDLQALVSQGKFRIDLYYRLESISFYMPPLRKRTDDLYPLALFFIRKFCQKNKIHLKAIDEASIDPLTQYDWPGNIREYQNFIEKLVIFSAGDVISGDIICNLLDEKVSHSASSSIQSPRLSAPRRAKSGVLSDLEREKILEVMGMVGGDRRQASSILGISPTTLWRRLKLLGADD
jgi:transcriptional regulator with PAS, ATPase and Fis domain